jgi:hypothetical protein
MYKNSCNTYFWGNILLLRELRRSGIFGFCCGFKKNSCVGVNEWILCQVEWTGLEKLRKVSTKINRQTYLYFFILLFSVFILFFFVKYLAIIPSIPNNDNIK